MKKITRKQNNKKRPLVSVVIPVFNGASYLTETITSVQKSTFKQIEVLLIDDGSSDKSKNLCKTLEKQYENIRFFSFTKNKGLGRVLNFALKQAKGTYICRINQDDRMLPNRIKTQVEFLEKRPEIVAVGSYIKQFSTPGIYNIIKFLPTDYAIKKVWLILSPFSDPSVMYRKKTALQTGGYDQSFWPADDVHMWYQLGKLGKLANIQKPLVEVRWHDKAGSLKFFRKNAIKTYLLHLWAHNNIQKANVFIHIFWIFQLIAGLTLPPRFNWGVYRVLKRIINSYFFIKNFLYTKVKEKTNTAQVVNHPKKLNLSGV